MPDVLGRKREASLNKQSYPKPHTPDTLVWMCFRTPDTLVWMRFRTPDTLVWVAPSSPDSSPRVHPGFALLLPGFSRVDLLRRVGKSTWIYPESAEIKAHVSREIVAYVSREIVAHAGYVAPTSREIVAHASSRVVPAEAPSRQACRLLLYFSHCIGSSSPHFT